MDTDQITRAIEALKQRRGLNLTTLSLASGVPYSTLHRKMAGRVGTLTLDELAALADALQVSAADLLAGNIPHEAEADAA